MKGSMTQVAEPMVLDVEAILTRHDPERRLQEYYAALMRENAQVNLVSRETTEADFLRLCAESLLPFETETLAQRPFASYLDIGAGGGMPSIPLLLTGKVSGKSVLYERTQKKAAALGRILASLSLTAHVIPVSFGETPRPDRFPLISMRYVSLDSKLAREILRILTPDGIFLYYSRPEIKLPGCEVTVYPYLVPTDTVARHFTIIRSK